MNKKLLISLMFVLILLIASGSVCAKPAPLSDDFDVALDPEGSIFVGDSVGVLISGVERGVEGPVDEVLWIDIVSDLEGLVVSTVLTFEGGSPNTVILTNPLELFGEHVLTVTITDFEGESTIKKTVSIKVDIDIPAEFADITSNLADIKNLYHTEQKLTFVKEDKGAISFDPGLNIFDNREQLENLQNFLVIDYDEENNVMVASVDTNSLTFLAGHSATIQFFHLAANIGLEEIDADNLQQYIKINVLVRGIQADDLTAYFDWENVTYDAENDILTLSVVHFTEYQVGQVEETDETAVEEDEEEEEELPQTGAGFPYPLLAGILLIAAGAFTRSKLYDEGK